MTNHDVTPAAAESNSVAPMAIDTNQWKIDLNDLHSGDVRLDFTVPTFDDDEEEPPTVKPRAARRVLGVMTAMLLVAGLGFAAFRGRPALQRAYASSSASWHAARATARPAPTPPAPPIVAASAPPPAPPMVATSGASPSPSAGESVPAISANALPNARKTKREPPKRRVK